MRLFAGAFYGPKDPTHLNLVMNASEAALRFNIIRPLKRTLTVY